MGTDNILCLSKGRLIVIAFLGILLTGGICVPERGIRGPEGTFCPSSDIEGPADLSLKGPRAVESTFVVDTGNHRIVDLEGPFNFQLQRTIGGPGSLDGQFWTPTDLVFVGEKGGTYMYVVDSGNNRIQKFDLNGTFILKWGTRGAGPGQFESPTGIGEAMDGNIYVADYGNNRIQKFDHLGQYLGGWGSKGSGEGQFEGPYDVEGEGIVGTPDVKPYVYVSDKGNNRIQKFTLEGKFIQQWTSFGSLKLSSPSGINAMDRLIVADTGNNRVVWLDGNGAGSWDGGSRRFNMPMGVSGGLFALNVADTGNNRVFICYRKY